MVKYKVLSSSEDGDTKLQKTGHKIEFTVSEVRQHVKKLDKFLSEIAAQKSLEEAKMTNIESHNEFIKDLTEEQQHAVKMYYQSLELYKQCCEKIAELEEAKKEYTEDIEDIKKQTGIDIKI